MNVIITFGNSTVPYFYSLYSYSDNNAVITKDDSYHELILTPYGWKIRGISQPHLVEFYEVASLDECDTFYSKYKTACSKYWDLWILPQQKSEYYINIINGLFTCLDNRSKHHYKCEDSIDPSHANALKKIEEKIEEKIIIAKLYLASDKDTKELVDIILTYDKDVIHETWMHLFGSLDIQLNRLYVIELLNQLKGGLYY